jgi:hypothetical protein
MTAPQEPTAPTTPSEPGRGRSPWLWVLGGLVAVLVVVLVIVLLTRDDDDSKTAATTTLPPTTTTTRATTTTAAPTTTTAPPTTTTTVVPPPSTTLPLPPITDDPQSYAEFLFVAWQNNDQTSAAQVASQQAVSQMFAQKYNPATQWMFAMCDPAAGSLYCTWNGQANAKITMTVRTLTGGLPIQVENVQFG